MPQGRGLACNTSVLTPEPSIFISQDEPAVFFLMDFCLALLNLKQRINDAESALSITDFLVDNVVPVKHLYFFFLFL